ncbi:hypothetical protein PAEAM_37140 [Paenibacillus sp. GM1FR]|nr:hypothetical protein PAEAM_37140 [Paenibacillus sp. GM1FR]
MQLHRSFRLFVYARHGTSYLYCSNVNQDHPSNGWFALGV